MSQKVRVRFAPSPTGPLHIGGVRTALFNYLFAKKNQGTFILRIEDTDQSRYVPGAEAYIVEALNWLGIPFDEGPNIGGDFGPYRQSERKELYQEYALRLVQEGKAYYAFDTGEELAAQRATSEARKETFIYNWANRMNLVNSLSLSEAEVQQRLDAGTPYTIRFKMWSETEEQHIQMTDLIRGEVPADLSLLDDKVLFKSDGMPTYHLANIVDDHLMKISHVIRGEEWLPSLPLHVQLYKAFGWDPPQFAHLSLILKPNGKGKLSKRDGLAGGFPVFPLEWNAAQEDTVPGYREEGYLPEAVVNMLAFLGWNPGTTQELFSLKELVEAFNLSQVNKAGPKFDPDKAKWYQAQYFKLQSDEVLADQLAKMLQSKGIPSELPLEKIAHTIKERATFAEDLWGQGHFFFVAPSGYDPKASKKAFKEDTAALLAEVKEVIGELSTFTAEVISEGVKLWLASKEIGMGKVMMPLRLALVGSMMGPDVFLIMELLGRTETLTRIQAAIDTIS